DDSEGRSGYRPGGQLIRIARGRMSVPETMADERGHWLLALPDEYRDRDGCSDKSVGICMHSMMASTADIKRRLCTDFDHLIQPTDQRPLSLGSSITIAPEPGCAFACDGARLCCDSVGGCNST